LKWVLPEADADKAIEIRDVFCQGLHEILAPDVFPAEVGHVLAKAERRGIIPFGTGVSRLADILRTLPQLYPSLPDLLPRAYAIGAAFRHSVYDCLYIALAERETCEFITADDRTVIPFHHLPGIVALIQAPSRESVKTLMATTVHWH
jgi:predicted nucleic acid-binding protein